jgi:type III restriction enzyme
VNSRRDAGYFIKPKGAQTSGLLHEVFVTLECVNEIRRRIRAWREDGYRGVTPVTRKLLDH